MPELLAKKRIGEGICRVCMIACAAFVPMSTQAKEASENDLSVPELAPCSTRYSLLASPRPKLEASNAKASIREDYASIRDWGTEKNVLLIPALATGLGEPGLRVRYPQDSSSPSDADKADVPRGGLGFYTREAELRATDRACLKYHVRFEPGFDFVRGGKLPGLYGGDAPSGGDEVTGKNGFSMRFMWREDGQGELYEYVVDDEGASIGRGWWTFPTGRWVSLEQEIVLNAPGKADGLARVWVDGKPVLEQRNIEYRTSEDVAIDGLMFSSFFGGTGQSWRSPRDQSVDFAAFRIYSTHH